MESSVWDKVMVKKGHGGAGKVTEEEKNSIIGAAVYNWMRMGLTNRQIAFGIATMNVESGFNPKAKNPAPESTASGLGQFTDDTWERAVREYNKTFKGSINPDSSSSSNDTDAQIAVMGAYILTVWDKAATVSNDPMLHGFSQREIAYGMWHEGFGITGNVVKVAKYLNNAKPEGFNPAARDSFHDTYDHVSEAATNILKIGVPISRLDLLDRASHEKFVRYHPDAAGSLGHFAHHNAARGETLRREGNHVYRVEPDGSLRGFFISE